MSRSIEIFDKYFGFCLSQDPFKMHVVRAFCSVADRFDGCDSWFSSIDDDLVRSVLDDEDYKTWLALKADYTNKVATV